jgi:hypothetical protein
MLASLQWVRDNIERFVAAHRPVEPGHRTSSL